MKTFDIPLLPITLERNTDEKLNDRDVPGIELEYLWPKYKPRAVFTGAFIAGGKDGIAISWCAEAPHNALLAKHKNNKENVFEDDCLEVFLQPPLTKADGAHPAANKAAPAFDGAHPAQGAFSGAPYYCWEINPAGACLDYTATPSSENTEAPENVPGITFDYNWKSHAVWRQSTDDEFWYLELFIPWSDFGLNEQPVSGTIWRATLNRIDQSAKTARRRAPGTGDNPGYQTLLDDTAIPSFHQSAHFAEFTFR